MTTTKKIADDASDAGADSLKTVDDMLASLRRDMRPAGATEAPVAGQRCGLIAIVGKPNVGKSTLLNALVGQKISITSRKAQTTRHRITGMHTVGPTQFVFVDTPGFQTLHGNALNKSLNKTVVGAVADVDLILFVVEAGSFTPADARVLALLAKNIPICEKFLPEQAWWYAADELTDRSERFMASEMVREKLFRLTGDELPYTSTVVIDKFEEEPPARKGQKRLLRIAATIVVERDGHKAMVIGDKGERIKRIGMETRVELEKLLDCKVFIEMWVKVRSGWADDEARVRSFGYE